MTRSFDTIYEAPLRSDDFGEGGLTLMCSSELTGRQVHQRRLGIEDDAVPRIARKGGPDGC
jgi:hypothetical protein